MPLLTQSERNVIFFNVLGLGREGAGVYLEPQLSGHGRRRMESSGPAWATAPGSESRGASNAHP